MTETKPYNLTKTVYTKIVFTKRVKKTWWIYLALILVAIAQFFLVKETNWFYIGFAFAYPILTFGYLYYWIHSKNRKLIFEETKMSFDNDYLLFVRNENESKIPYKNIYKLVEKEDYWLLYLMKSEFIYTPKNIFHTTEDYNSFLNLISKQ